MFWNRVRELYVRWKQSRGVSSRQIMDYVSILDRHLKGYVIRGPMDVIEVFCREGNTL